MHSLDLRLAPVTATVFTLLACIPLAQGGIPPVPNPSTSTPVGPPSPPTPYDSARVANAMSGAMYFEKGTRSTQKFTGISCMPVGPKICGGGGTVAAGASFSLFNIEISISAQWTGPVVDACKLCQIFLCANSTTTVTTTKGKAWRENGLGQAGPKHDFESTSSITIPDPTSAALKQDCIDTPEAKAFCCPDKHVSDAEHEEGPGEDSLLPSMFAPGDLLAHPDQYGFGTGFPTAPPVDFFDIGAVVEIDLRTVPLLPGQSWEPQAELPNEWWHVAHLASRVSLAQRLEIATQIVDALGLGVPGTTPPAGHVLVALAEDGGAVRVIDLGTVYEILLLDTLRLGNRADVDMDGSVDSDDLGIVLQDLREPSTLARGDLDLDGWVTDADVDIVLAAM